MEAPELKLMMGDHPELDAIIEKMDMLSRAIDDRSFTAKPPEGIAETLDAIGENLSEFLVSNRDIRPAAGAYEMVVTTEPAPALRSFMSALTAWVAENDVGHVLERAGWFRLS